MHNNPTTIHLTDGYHVSWDTRVDGTISGPAKLVGPFTTIRRANIFKKFIRQGKSWSKKAIAIAIDKMICEECDKASEKALRDYDSGMSYKEVMSRYERWFSRMDSASQF
jgi:hypothetical protein